MRLGKLLAAGLVAAFGIASSHAANATIVERVVAVVGERPILLTDLRKRARPFLIHILATTPNPAQQAAQESDMYRELLNRMIDDRLEEQAADKGHIVATSEEIDRGMRQKADSLNLSMKDLLAAAKQQGLSEQEYRDEIRRQILEGKLIQLRVMSRVRVTDEDARAAYTHWRKETDGEKLTLVNLFVLRIPPEATPQDIQVLQQTADKYAQQARAQGNFCDLVKQYSSDPKGCQHGLQGVSTLLPALQTLTAPMKEGDISNAEIFTDEQVIVVAQLEKAPHVPSFDEVKPQMKEQAMGEVVERQRKIWLDELKKNIYVDVRL